MSVSAIAVAEHQSAHGPKFGIGMCLQRVHLAFGVGAKYPDATTGWAEAKLRHSTTDTFAPPAGVPIWWTGGSKGHGHVAISAGHGFCWSTDINRLGFFDLVRISDIAARWGLTFVGWSEDINDVRVYTPPPKPVNTHTLWAKHRGLILAAIAAADAEIPKSRRGVHLALRTAAAAISTTRRY